MAKRKNHAPDFKAKVALAILNDNKIVAELGTEYGRPSNSDHSRFSEAIKGQGFRS